MDGEDRTVITDDLGSVVSVVGRRPEWAWVAKRMHHDLICCWKALIRDCRHSLALFLNSGIQPFLCFHLHAGY